MKKVIVMIVLGIVVGLAANCSAQEIKEIKPFSIYADRGSSGNHFIPSGWMGDYSDLKLNDNATENPHSGSTCIKITYTPKGNNGWAGIYWQSSANNWGSRQSGFDLTGFNKLSLWARGATGNEILKLKIGGIDGQYADSTSAEIGPIQLTSDWKEYTINLTGKDLSYINGGLCFSIAADQNPQGAEFYLDDIQFTKDALLKPETKKKESLPFVIYENSGSIKNHYIPSGFMGDYSDIKVDQRNTLDPYSAPTSIKITYNNKGTQGARWAGVYWQNPANNWGAIEGGYDLSNAKKLTFWAKGETGNEVLEEVKIGGITGEYSDSDVRGIGPIKLTKEWKQYTIDLADSDLSYISGGFCWATNLDSNPDGAVFYLDEIRCE